jgi:hypothetical protein
MEGNQEDGRPEAVGADGAVEQGRVELDDVYLLSGVAFRRRRNYTHFLLHLDVGWQ